MTWFTLEGEQQKYMLAVEWGFQPLNHNKQKCKMFPNDNHDDAFETLGVLFPCRGE